MNALQHFSICQTIYFIPKSSPQTNPQPDYIGNNLRGLQTQLSQE